MGLEENDRKRNMEESDWKEMAGRIGLEEKWPEEEHGRKWLEEKWPEEEQETRTRRLMNAMTFYRFLLLIPLQLLFTCLYNTLCQHLS
jgi:hypothetical protein